MGEDRRVRDPIHGFVHLSSDEAEVVETGVFQRLRGIRQLAMANMVYPGALHTRFDHTLGVFHVTSLLCNVFGLQDDDKRLVRLSLLHDLGSWSVLPHIRGCSRFVRGREYVGRTSKDRKPI